MAKLVDIWRKDGNDGEPVDLKPRLWPLVIDDNLTIIMDLNSLGATRDNPLVRGKQLEEFTRKLKILTKEELKGSLEVNCREILEILGQVVPCVGCRRSVNRSYYNLMRNPALDPLIVTDEGILTVKDEILESPQMLCTLLHEHSERLNSLADRQPRNKKSRRCGVHSLEVQRMRPSPGAWREVWDCMKPACRQEITLIEHRTLATALETYLCKNRFCGECRTKVLLALSLLITEPEAAKEKGYVPALYAGIKRCTPKGHIHLPTNTDYISAIIDRAQPELIGRERHAKTLEIAQEEVLTCLGICVSERLLRVHRKLREEEFVCRVLAAVAVEALSRKLQMAVEGKQGITQLELLCEELTREDLAKQQRRQKQRLKRKKKKERRYESEEKENACQRDEQKDNQDDKNPCVFCMEITEMYENVTSDKSNLVTKTSTTICNCPDCKKTSIKLECETNVAFTRKKKNADASLLDKDIEALKSFDTQNISKRMDVSFMPCHECEALFEKRDGKWMIREEFEKPSNNEIMDAWLGRTNKRFSMRYDVESMANKLLVVSSSRRDSSEQSSQDCGYSSEHNISSSSLPSTPEGSELACSESCCNQDQDADCQESIYSHNKLVHSNTNVFLLKKQINGKVSRGPTLTQMLEEGYSSEDESKEESYIPAEEVKEFKSRMCQVLEKRQELRDTLRKRFAMLCSHRKPYVIPRHQ